MAKYQVNRGGGEYVFPTLGIIASDGDIIDAPAGLDVAGLLPAGKATAAASSPADAPADSVTTPDPAAAAAPEGA